MNLGDDTLDNDASAEWDADLLDGFPDDDPAASDQDAMATATPSAASSTSQPRGKAPSVKSQPQRRRSGGGGFLCFILVLLAGLTLSTGLLTATGAQPEMLLDFSGFQDPLTIGDFRAHPVNAFWLAALITLAAAVMAAVAVDRRVSGLSQSTDVDGEKLAAMAQLDPERPETWQDERLQSDPDLAPVVSNLLGHYNLQQAKLMRYVDLEGELHRLEAAIADQNADALDAAWENPAAGSLADQVARVLKRNQEMDEQATGRTEGFEEQGPDLVTGLRDARTWNNTTLESLNQQGAAAERLARGLSKLADMLPQDDQRQRQRDRVRQALTAVQTELANLPVRGAEKRRDLEAPLTGLVERASRLAFQIAMEVARLGVKGERLLPLTQDLEELTTELRRSTEGSSRETEDDPRERALDTVRGRLAELDPKILEGDASDGLGDSLRELTPLAGQSAQALAQVSRTFNVQTARLVQMLNVMGDLTGMDVAGEGDPTAAPGSGLAVEAYDPFGSQAAPESGLVADPFASSAGSIFDTSTAADAGEFGQNLLADTPEPAAETPAATVEPGLMDLTPEPAEPVAPTASVEPLDLAEPAEPTEPITEGVPSAAETIYDLSEFSAEKLAPEAVAEPAEPIYDLSEFGAERIS